MVAFVCYFYGGTPMEWLNQEPREILKWHNEAVKLHNKLNSSDG